MDIDNLIIVALKVNSSETKRTIYFRSNFVYWIFITWELQFWNKLVRQSQIVQSVMQDCQYVLSHLLPECHLLVQGPKKNLNTLNIVKTFVTELLVLFHRGENSQNKQAAEEIHSFPSLKLSKHEIVWKQHTTFLNRARDDSKRYAVSKAFFALKGRTDITWNITGIAR